MKIPLPPVRSHVIMLRCNDEEARAIRCAAALMGMETAVWLRQLALPSAKSVIEMRGKEHGVAPVRRAVVDGAARRRRGAA